MPDDPYRDRQMASRPRTRPRYSVDAGAIAGKWLQSSEAKAMQRQTKVAGAIRQALPAALQEKLQLGAVRRGVLTVYVGDSVALAEMKQHYDAALRQALLAAGAGVTRLVYRLQKTDRSSRT